MSETPFDYAAYGINGDPEHHNTDSVLCWCAPTYDPERGIVVHRDMDEILSAARALGQADKADELARLTAERDALRSAMSEAERRLTAQFWPIDPDKYGLRYVGLEVAQKLRAALAAPEGVKP